MIRKSALSLAVVAVVAIGVIVFGRLANSDVQAMVLTTLFFAAFAVVLFRVIRKRRDLLGWLAVPFVVTAGLAGIWLGLPLITDNAVDEQVVTAPSVSSPADAPRRMRTAWSQVGSSRPPRILARVRPRSSRSRTVRPWSRSRISRPTTGLTFWCISSQPTVPPAATKAPSISGR